MSLIRRIEGLIAEAASLTGIRPLFVGGKDCSGNATALPICATTPKEGVNAVFISPRPNKMWEESFSATIGSGFNTYNWTEIVKAAGMTVSQSGGNGVIVGGTVANEESIYRSKISWSDSMVLRSNVKLSAYNANTRLWIELVDVIGDNLAITSSTTAVSITKNNHGFTDENVGQSVFIGALKNIVGGTIIPGQWVIASITNVNTFVVTATGSTGTVTSGTCSVWGYNSIRTGIVNSSTTTALLGATRNGRNGVADSSYTISTITSGSYQVISIEDGIIAVSESTVNSQATLGSRALRNVGIPASDKELYLQVRVTNGTTSPTSTTFTIGMLRLEDNASMAVSFPTQRGVAIAGNGLAANVTNFPTGFQSSGAAAHDAAVSGNPLRMAGRALTSDYTSVASGDTADFISTLKGVQIVKLDSIPENHWSYAGGASGIVSSTADVPLKGLVASLRNYVKTISIGHDLLGAVTEYVIKDGSTIIYRGKLQTPAVEMETIIFDPPLKTTAGAALNFALISSVTGGVYVNASGYVAP